MRGALVLTVVALTLGAALVALESAGTLPRRPPGSPVEILSISAVIFSPVAVLHYPERLVERRALALARSGEARYRSRRRRRR